MLKSAFEPLPSTIFNKRKRKVSVQDASSASSNTSNNPPSGSLLKKSRIESNAGAGKSGQVVLKPTVQRLLPVHLRHELYKREQSSLPTPPPPSLVPVIHVSHEQKRQPLSSVSSSKVPASKSSFSPSGAINGSIGAKDAETMAMMMNVDTFKGWQNNANAHPRPWAPTATAGEHKKNAFSQMMPHKTKKTNNNSNKPIINSSSSTFSSSNSSSGIVSTVSSFKPSKSTTTLPLPVSSSSSSATAISVASSVLHTELPPLPHYPPFDDVENEPFSSSSSSSSFSKSSTISPKQRPSTKPSKTNTQATTYAATPIVSKVTQHQQQQIPPPPAGVLIGSVSSSSSSVSSSSSTSAFSVDSLPPTKPPLNGKRKQPVTLSGSSHNTTKKKPRKKTNNKPSEDDGNRRIMDRFARPVVNPQNISSSSSPLSSSPNRINEKDMEECMQMEIDEEKKTHNNDSSSSSSSSLSASSSSSNGVFKKSSYISRLLHNGQVPNYTYNLPHGHTNPSLPCFRSPLSEDERVPKQLHFFVQHVVDRDGFIWLLGVNKDGQSVACRTEFYPWFYVRLPGCWTDADTAALQKRMKSQGDSKFQNGSVNKYPFQIQSMQVVQKVDLIGWTNNTKRPHLKIHFRNSSSLNHAMLWFRNVYSFWNNTTRKSQKLQLGHVKMKPELQFMFQTGLDLNSWVNVTHCGKLPELKPQKNPAHLFNYLPDDRTKNKPWRHTTCQIEVNTNLGHIKLDKETIDVPPCVYATLDLEMISPSGGFARAERPSDAVCCGAIRLQRQGSKIPLARIVVMVGACDPIPGVTLLCYQTEREAIDAMIQIMIRYNDVDSLFTFNGIRFDLPYLLERAKSFDLPEAWYFTRFLTSPCDPPEERDASSKQAGVNKWKMLKTPGRTQFDVMAACKQITTTKFGSYKLKDLASEILKDESKKDEKKIEELNSLDRVALYSEQELKQKGLQSSNSEENKQYEFIDEVEKMVHKYPVSSFDIKLDPHGNDVTGKMDFPYELILPFSVGTSESRKVLGIYNLTDVDTTWLISEKRNFVAEYNAMSNLTRIGITELLTSGQQIKSMSLIYKECEASGWVVNEDGLEDYKHLIEEDYEGGHVEKARCGFYKRDVVVGDFNSLYPSIMIGNRLCYSTFVKTRKWDPIRKRFVHDDAWLKLIQTLKLPVKEVQIGNDTFTFVQVPMEQCVLPKILETLLAARKEARKIQETYKEAGDMVRYNILEGRQLAMKLCANSLYGFTGAKHGLLSYPPIARTVTFIGREMFEKMRTLAQSDKYKAELIYGDTDSVFLIFPLQRNEQGDIEMDPEKQTKLQWKIGLQLFAEASGDDPNIPAIFPKPCRIELEKILRPLLLLGPKKYAGRLVTVDVPKLDKSKPVSEQLDKVTELFRGEMETFRNVFVCVLYSFQDPSNLKNWKVKYKSTPKITGLECVRRDWCGLTRTLSKNFLQKVLIEDKLKEAVELVEKTLKRIEDGDVTYEEVSISKSYKGKDGYQKSQSPERLPQVVLAKRMENRGTPMEAGKVFVSMTDKNLNIAGDRFSYVIARDRPNDVSVKDLAHSVGKTKKTKEIDVTHEKYFLKVQDLKYARENKLPVDLLWLFDKQLEPPFGRAVKFITQETNQLFAECRARLVQKYQRMSDIRSYFSANAA